MNCWRVHKWSTWIWVIEGSWIDHKRTCRRCGLVQWK